MSYDPRPGTRRYYLNCRHDLATARGYRLESLLPYRRPRRLSRLRLSSEQLGDITARRCLAWRCRAARLEHIGRGSWYDSSLGIFYGTVMRITWGEGR